MTNRTIGSPSVNSDSWTFDAMGRRTGETNPLGTWSYGYVDDAANMFEVAGAVSSGQTDSITFNGTSTATYTATGSDTLATVAAQLALKIQQLSLSGVSATASGPFIHITAPGGTTYASSPGAKVVLSAVNSTSEMGIVSGVLSSGQNFTVTVNGHNATYGPTSGSDTVQTVATGLATKINLLSLSGVSATASGSAVNITASSGTTYSSSPSTSTTMGSAGTKRLASINYPNSQVTNYSYFGNSGDQRLQQIANLNSSSGIISQFTYQYNPVSEITQWQQQQNGNNEFHNFAYDLAGQLCSAQAGSGSPLPPFSKQHYYNFDLASNRNSVQTSQLQCIRLGGTVNAGPPADQLSITVTDAGLSGTYHTETVTYTVQSGDTIGSICTQLAAEITADSNLAGIGVNAVASGPEIYVKSSSANVTTYATSTNSGATETIVPATVANGVTNITVNGPRTTSTTPTFSVTVVDAGLTGGSKTKSYTAGSSDTLAQIATGLKNQINGDSSLSVIGVTASTSGTASVAGTVLNIASTSINTTTYSTSVGTAVSETLSQSPNLNGNQLVVIGGSAHPGDNLSINVYDAGLASSPETVTYPVSGSDTLNTIASGACW